MATVKTSRSPSSKRNPMKQLPIKIPIWSLIKKLIPHIRAIGESINEAREKNSPGGTKVTKEELQDLLLDHSMDLVELLAEVIFQANKK